MGFFTIFAPDGLSDANYARALKHGPSYMSTRRRNHQSLLRAAGFDHVAEFDVTKEFLVTQRGWHDGRQRYEDVLIESEGRALFDERQLDARLVIEGIEAGLLRRALFVCR